MPCIRVVWGCVGGYQFVKCGVQWLVWVLSEWCVGEYVYNGMSLCSLSVQGPTFMEYSARRLPAICLGGCVSLCRGDSLTGDTPGLQIPFRTAVLLSRALCIVPVSLSIQRILGSLSLQSYHLCAGLLFLPLSGYLSVIERSSCTPLPSFLVLSGCFYGGVWEVSFLLLVSG